MLDLIQLTKHADRKPHQLSGGQQQRVALARALAPHPKVLLLDEPLSALDYKLRKDMQIELKRLQHETGITFIFVTHDQEEALTMSDRIAVMSNGKILQVGSAHDIYDKPAERFVANFIGETNFLEGEVTEVNGVAAAVRLASGAVVTAGLPDGFRPKGKVTVVVRPEHADVIHDRTKATVNGTSANGGYLSTDKQYHVRRDSSGEFSLRHQDSPTGRTTSEPGPPVG